MEIKLLNKCFNVNNSMEVEQVIKVIEEMIVDANMIFSHLEIENDVIYEDYQQYLLDHLNETQSVEVKLTTVTSLVNDSVLSMKEYLSRMIPAVSHLAGQFYQGDSREAWGNFEEMIEGIQWMYTVILKVDSFPDKPYQNWNQYVVIGLELGNHLKELEQALRQQDTILLADIINYEVVRLLKELEHELQKTIDNEVVRNDVN